MGQSSNKGPVIVGFFDLHGNFTAKDLESLREDYPHIALVTVFGLRRLSTYSVLKAFELGADGVFLASCPLERDPYPETRDKFKGRMALARAIVEALGLGGERLELCDMPERGLVDGACMDEWVQKIKEIGPSPLRV